MVIEAKWRNVLSVTHHLVVGVEELTHCHFSDKAQPSFVFDTCVLYR